MARATQSRIYELKYKAIESLSARRILDSRGNWTIEVELNGIGASAPAGASVGAAEARVIPVDRAVEIVNTKLQELIGIELNQTAIDVRLKQIDGTHNYAKIGGNTAISISAAAYRAISPKPRGLTFPLPLTNIFGGGAHGGGSDIQEFLVCPTKAKTFPDAVDATAAARNELRRRLIDEADVVGMNDEGALVAKIDDDEALDIISGVASSFKLRIGLDMAATQLWDSGRAVYVYRRAGRVLNREKQIDYVQSLIKDYKLFYVEDPLHENDFEGFAELTKKAKGCLICGDDLTTTNPERIAAAAKKRAIRAVIIKPNQIGTVTQTEEAVRAARRAKILPVISHRSAETADKLISHLALDWQIPLIKAGASDFVTKINELLRLWQSTKEARMARIRI